MTETAVESPVSSPAPPAPDRRRRLGGRVVAIGLPTVVLATHMAAYGRWLVDDAAITFAYARSLTTGAGPVLQPGADPVEGWSNPAWLGITMLGRLLGLFDRAAWFGVPDLVLFPKVVAVLCGAGVFAAFYAVARTVSSRPAYLAAAAGVVTALVPSYAIWFSSGLENPLLALAATTLAAVLARSAAAGTLLTPKVALSCGLLAAVAALTRPDGLIYAVAYPVAVLLVRRPGQLRRAVVAVAVAAVAVLLPVGTYLGWRWVSFGMLLPNTAVAKAQRIPSPADLGRPAELVAYTGWLTVVLAIGVIGAAMMSGRPGPDRGTARTVLAMLLVPLGLALTAFAVLSGDWMAEFRFATPVWPLAALATTVAAGQVWPLIASRARVAVAVTAAVAVALTGFGWLSAAREFRGAPTVPMCVVAQNTGTSVNGYAEILGVTTGSVLAPDVGGAALTSRLEVIDLVGLTDAPIAAFHRADDMAGLRNHVFDVLGPTFIKTHDYWSTRIGLLEDPRMAADYVPVLTTGPVSGDWVRRDAVPDGQALEEVRRWASGTAAPAVEFFETLAPRSSCGPVLTPARGPVLTTD